MQLAPECQISTPALPANAACQDVANLAAHQSHCLGGSDIEVSQAFHTALVGCRKPLASAAERDFVATMNHDRQRLAQQLVSQNLTPIGYLHRTWSYAAKTAAARRAPQWMVQWAVGDADGDLVPDARDQCPNTPDLAPTDLRGCVVPEPTLDLAPSAEAVRASLEVVGDIPFHSACMNAPAPDAPRPLRLHLGAQAASPDDADSNNSLLNFSMMPSTNQPAGCPLYYELMANVEGLPGGSVVIRRILASSDVPSAPDAGPSHPNVDYVPGVVAHCEFIRLGDSGTEPAVPCPPFPGTVPKLNAVTFASGVEGYWRVRAVNGAGLASPWSDLPVRQQTLYDAH
jgi:hypothetical protein